MSLLARGAALPSSGVTIGRHASASAPPDGTGAEDLLSNPLEAEPVSPAESVGRVGALVRAAKAVGFHLGAIILFAVPAVLLWWHVWSGHPANMLTCACGDPAQEVWFVAWPAWAIAHLHNPFFSSLVNVPSGANLLSNTSGTLVGVVLAPVTWLFGPIAATNVALTLTPALSAWACFAAIRPLVKWKWGAVPAALVFGYSAAIFSSLLFGHVSVSLLVFPPFLFTTLHEIVIRQEHSVRRDGLLLAALLVGQFLVSPEVLVLCAIFMVIGVLAVMAVGWRQVRVRAGHAFPALALGLIVAAALLAYPVWFGVAGPQAVTGVLFIIAPLAGVPLSGIVLPGAYGALGNTYVRFGGYLGPVGPPPDYLGPGLLATVASVVLGRRRALTWLLLFLGVIAFWLSLGPYAMSAPLWFHRVWLPWHDLSKLPLLREILPDQIAPFITLFVAFLLAIGLDALYLHHRRATSWMASHRRAVTATATAAAALLAVIPVFITFDLPLRVVTVKMPSYIRTVAPALPARTVVLTVPFAISGSTQPMLWQAVDNMQFDLAGAALKTPGPTGGPVAQGSPGSARRILTDLTVVGAPEPSGTSTQIATVLHALRQWRVSQVVVAGASRDPVYATGFFTMALGMAPTEEAGAQVWTLPLGIPLVQPAFGASLSFCREGAQNAPPASRAGEMAHCVLYGAGRA
jgi:dolichyl-phosphate beta-glucosyltransferase